MNSFYLIDTEELGLRYVIVGYDEEANEISRESFFQLYNARMRLYDIEDEGNICEDCTR